MKGALKIPSTTKKNDTHEIGEFAVITKMLFITAIAFHLFINTEQKDLMYVLVSLTYLAFHFTYKRRHSEIFRDVLAAILGGAVALVLNRTLTALILGDYIFIFMCFGLSMQYLQTVLRFWRS